MHPVRFIGCQDDGTDQIVSFALEYGETDISCNNPVMGCKRLKKAQLFSWDPDPDRLQVKSFSPSIPE